MTDFHSHILPYMDDGAQSVEMSMRMLGESAAQGVDAVVATPHFYADTEDPARFLVRRAESWRQLKAAVDAVGGALPSIYQGAEILYFPGMSGAEELRGLMIEGTDCMLIEPPMMPWTDNMLDEIEQTGASLRCVPVIAHIDRYMRYLRDSSLIDRVRGRRLLVQVNASFFLRPDMSAAATILLAEKRIHLVGSDCHNMDTRAPNLFAAAEAMRALGMTDEFARLSNNANFLLHR